MPGTGVLAVPSADRLFTEWRAGLANGGGGGGHLRQLMARLDPGASLITVQDGHPAALSWLGSATGRRVYPLGVDGFGQSGDIPTCTPIYGIDAPAIVDMAARACVEAVQA